MSIGVFILSAVAVAGLAALVQVRRAVRRMLQSRDAGPYEARCKCGYLLTNLSVPRCPECGRVVGFDATPEELGLTQAELQRAQQAREQRQASSDQGSNKPD